MNGQLRHLRPLRVFSLPAGPHSRSLLLPFAGAPGTSGPHLLLFRCHAHIHAVSARIVPLLLSFSTGLRSGPRPKTEYPAFVLAGARSECRRGPIQTSELRGTPSLRIAGLRTPKRHSVSVPFTRGTPSLVGPERCARIQRLRFSPLHEGDAFVAPAAARTLHRCLHCFSPLHEGDAFVAGPAIRMTMFNCFSFSPLHEGDTSVGAIRAAPRLRSLSVSVPFTRGTPSLAVSRHIRIGMHDHVVSVPFTRGTPSLARC